MIRAIKNAFLERWHRFFPQAELPIFFYYTDYAVAGEKLTPPEKHRCLLQDLARVRSGTPVTASSDSLGCEGARRYLGFSRELHAGFEFLLSCGLPGEIQGERYKASPTLVTETLRRLPEITAPARFIVFKRWDQLERNDEPAVVIFFATPVVLSGLFTLVNYDESDPNAVIAPFASGCGALVQLPFAELRASRPRAVLGLFDVSARPHVPDSVLSLAIPWPKFVTMVENIDKSFLATPAWGRIQASLQEKSYWKPA